MESAKSGQGVNRQALLGIAFATVLMAVLLVAALHFIDAGPGPSVFAEQDMSSETAIENPSEASLLPPEIVALEEEIEQGKSETAQDMRAERLFESRTRMDEKIAAMHSRIAESGYQSIMAPDADALAARQRELQQRREALNKRQAALNDKTIQ